MHYQPIWKFYLADLTKWVVKVLVKHPDGARIPSFSDWESRTQKAYFDCSRARCRSSAGIRPPIESACSKRASVRLFSRGYRRSNEPN